MPWTHNAAGSAFERHGFRWPHRLQSEMRLLLHRQQSRRCCLSVLRVSGAVRQSTSAVRNSHVAPALHRPPKALLCASTVLASQQLGDHRNHQQRL